MSKITIEGREFDVDGNGFLTMPDIWNEEIAQLFAKADGTGELNDKHWAVINYIRAYWKEKNMAPMIRLLCQNANLRLKEIYELFPWDLQKGLVRLQDYQNLTDVFKLKNSGN